MNIWKCNNCEYGPCFVQCDHERSDKSFYGDSNYTIEPTDCHCDQYQEAKWERVNVPTINTKLCGEMNDWVAAHWDDIPEILRDMMVGCGIEPRIPDPYSAIHAMSLIREYDEEYLSLGVSEECQSMLNKIKKVDLLNGIFPQAFRAGMIFCEMKRQQIASGELQDDKD